MNKNVKRVLATITAAKRHHLRDVLNYAKQVKYFNSFGDKKNAGMAASQLFIAKEKYRAARRCWLATMREEGLPLSDFTTMYYR